MAAAKGLVGSLQAPALILRLPDLFLFWKKKLAVSFCLDSVQNTPLKGVKNMEKT